MNFISANGTSVTNITPVKGKSAYIESTVVPSIFLVRGQLNKEVKVGVGQGCKNFLFISKKEQVKQIMIKIFNSYPAPVHTDCTSHLFPEQSPRLIL